MIKKLLLSIICTVALTGCCTDYEAIVSSGTPVMIEGRTYYYYNNNYYWRDGTHWRYYPRHHFHYYHPPRYYNHGGRRPGFRR